MKHEIRKIDEIGNKVYEKRIQCIGVSVSLLR